MQVPVRLAVLLRPRVAPGVLLAGGFSTLVLAATPFLFDLVADHYGIGLAAASLIGVAQLGGFTVGSWGAGRWLRPQRRIFIVALALALVANAASFLLPPFAVLVGLRLISGLALGLITWFGWVQVFGDDDRVADLAVVGPVVGLAAGPLVALFAIEGGAAGVFALLAGAAVVPLVFNRGTGATGEAAVASGRSKPVPAALVMLIALALFTFGGSAVFQYAVVLATDEVGLTTGTVALLFSGNAAIAIPAARWPWRRGIPGPWMAVTACCAVILATSDTALVFGAALVLWGFAFWMAIPGVFKALAERSANPGDRAGDAHAVMAAGRVVGPFVGGVLIDTAGTGWLGLFGGALMVTSAGLVFAVRRGVAPRSERLDDATNPGGGP